MSNYISCPHCGTEYTPSEVYLPKCFLGNTEYVKRDMEGKIQSVAGSDMDTYEMFTCDYCKKSFSVSATVSFECSPVDPIEDLGRCISYTERFKLKEF